MLNCSDPECILHHHHYYHGHVQHHLQDDRAHHEHPTHHPMSGESDGVQDAIIQDYLNDTDSELSSLSHLDAPSESVYMICGVLIAMLLVGFIIILLAVTISMARSCGGSNSGVLATDSPKVLIHPPTSSLTFLPDFSSLLTARLTAASNQRTSSVKMKGREKKTPEKDNFGKTLATHGCPLEDTDPENLESTQIEQRNTAENMSLDKLRKREESSGIHRSNVVHPEGVLQATTVVGTEASPELAKSSPLEDIFIAPVSNRTSFASAPSDNSLYSSESTQLPMFLYSTGNSRNSLNSSNDQDVLVHPSGPAEDIENNNNNNNNSHHNKEEATKKNIKGKLRKLVRRKSPPAENYALPLELREQLKQIYVY